MLKDTNNEKLITSCSASQDCYYDDNNKYSSCYIKLYDLLLPFFLINKGVDIYNQELNNMVILPPNYIVPDIILKQSDVMISYGTNNDMSTEKIYTSKYNKPSYTYDCGNQSVELPNKLCHFASECISTDDFILREEYNQISSGKIHSFGQKINELTFNNKKIFLKMDIAGAEYKALPDILNYSDKLTGLSVSFHLEDVNSIINILPVLEQLKKDFVLVARSNHFVRESSGKSCENMNGEISSVVVCSYINKNLLKNYSIKWDNSDIKIEGEIYNQSKSYATTTEYLESFNEQLKKVPHGRISYKIVAKEKLKQLKNKILNK